MPRGNQHLRFVKLFLSLLMLLAGFNGLAQSIPLANAFAHNDYWHKRPLFDALDNGFTHMEADIYLRNGKLIVAHILPMLEKSRTLESLYLAPLMDCINGNSKLAARPVAPITLMIDIKSNANKTYSALEVLLNKYRSVISGYENGVYVQRQINIVITGNKPFKMLKAEQNRLAFIDEDLMKTYHDTLATNVYQTASCKYGKMLKWSGKGEMPANQKQKLRAFVNMAHKFGKKVRLWASPENEVVWTQLLNCGVDLINTDKLEELKGFLLARQGTYANVDLP
ncbi:phosphatidylinositol-specific phospholipase C/glycerophosphodiester phosphodiesterase family protein [Mucilaginibacter sp.]|uniref:phosphatidylinositol-specific phospholipase C/glycerophosphodiester phosphodiesterase family protein n=1 Tax=Mucilaginibacter sp. TaxID=1882438 RepID=UPI003267FB88